MNVEGLAYVVVLMLSFGVMWYFMTRNQIVILKVENGEVALKTLQKDR